MGTAIEFRFIKASDKILSPAYDKDPGTIFCMINIMAASGTPGFEEYSAGIVSSWIHKYNVKYVILFFCFFPLPSFCALFHRITLSLDDTK